MGKRGGGDAKKLAELHAALKEKAEAEKANLTNMDPPPPPKKKKTAEPSPSEASSRASSPTPSLTEPPAVC